MTKWDFYSIFQDEMIELGIESQEVLSAETFMLVWRREYPQLKIPRHNTLSSCDQCITLKASARSFPRGTLEHVVHTGKMKRHLQQVRDERREQTTRDQAAAFNPETTWTVTTDFMQDFLMPWLSKRPKTWY
jgi:hypothetical protein